MQHPLPAFLWEMSATVLVFRDTTAGFFGNGNLSSQEIGMFDDTTGYYCISLCRSYGIQLSRMLRHHPTQANSYHVSEACRMLTTACYHSKKKVVQLLLLLLLPLLAIHTKPLWIHLASRSN